MSEAEDPWDWLERRLTEFLDAWEKHLKDPNGDSPTIGDFLGAGNDGVAPNETITNMQRMLLIELVTADLEYQLMSGGYDAPDDSEDVWELEDYLDAYPMLAPVPAELLFNDYQMRRQNGVEASVLHYCERFPHLAEQFRKLLGIDAPEVTMSLFRARRLPDLEPGEVIADDFRLTALLGQGSFAKVYLAMQMSLGRMVALKVSANHGNEAQTLVQLDHPNIVRVHDQRDLPDEGLRLLYMEYAPGGTLHDVVKAVESAEVSDAPTGELLSSCVKQSLERGGIEASFPTTLTSSPWPNVVCDLGIQLADALEYAHQKKEVLHRDIKPANVLLGANAKPKLADFNVSFSAQISGTAPAAYFGGSLAYMAPEQLQALNPHRERQASDLDGRSDLYSLAVVLWELLHGRRPFGDPAHPKDFNSLLDDLESQRQSPPRGSWGSNEVSRELQHVLTQCLEPNRDNRPAGGAELRRQLHLCLEPYARNLVRIESSWLGKLAVRWPIQVLSATLLIPNAVAAVLNYKFNKSWLEALAPNVADTVFEPVQTGINIVAFSIGIFVCLRYYMPIANAVKRRVRNEPIEPDTLEAMRHRSLNIGKFGTWVGVCLWTVCGCIYPVLLQLFAPNFPANGYPLFILDLCACGLIAGSYPFFLASLVTTRAFYPKLLDLKRVPDDEPARLEKLGESAGLYLLIAAGVPMIALLPIIILVLNQQPIYHFALVGLVIASIVGLFGSWRANSQLQKDIAALRYAVEPITPP